MFTQWIHYHRYLELAPRLFPALTTASFTSCSSADWPASLSPRRGRPRWWRRWPGCTSCGDVGNAGPACPWSRRRSWRWAGPERKQQRSERSQGFRKQVQERSRKYLFIGKDQEDGIPQLVLGQHPHQLLARFIHSFPVIAVHHKD